MNILSWILNLILGVISRTGYLGIFVLMFLQSINIPVPSEVIMPFSGFLASRGVFNFWLVVLIGTVGNLAGAYLSYKLAYAFLGSATRDRHPFLKKIASEKNLALAQKWFDKYGSISVFFSRMVPVVSTFISFPAGLAKMRLSLFLPLTFAGSFVWSYVLTKIGFILGANWSLIQVYFRKLDYIILAFIVVGIAYLAQRHFKKS